MDTAPAPAARASPHPHAALLVMLLWLLSAGWAWLGQQPPAVRPASADATLFSAERAEHVLRRVLPDAQPHPVGSVANARVRSRILDELRGLGLHPDVRTAVSCAQDTCATVHNVLARIVGTRPDDAVLLSAHYDSVPASPGVSDDGAGVAAVLEAARALLAGPAPPRDVWLLLADGEEAGLLGAEAFVHEPEFARIASVVNLEARGTGGASRLIETGPDNLPIVRALRPVLSQPAATSLDNALYERLPNGTDFTVYMRHGRHGANFAWAQGASRYHTPLDDLTHLDRRSLQHHGDNLLAAARAFAAQPATAAPGDGHAVYFRLLWPRLLMWPTTWNDALLIIALLGWGSLRLRHPRETRPARMLVPLCSVGAVVLPVLSWAAAWALWQVLRAAGTFPVQWTASAPWLVATFLLVPLPLALGTAWLTRRLRAGPALAIGSLFPFLLLAGLLRLGLPGAIHIGLLPLLAGVLAGHAWPRQPWAMAAASGVVAAALLAPYALLLHSAMGHALLPMASLVAALALGPVVPALTGSGPWVARLGWASAVAVLLCAGTGMLMRPFTASVPQPLNLHAVGSATQMRLHADAVPAFPQTLVDAGFAAPPASVAPWSAGDMRPGPTTAALPVPDMRLRVLDHEPNGTRHMHLHVQPQREVASITVLLPGAVPGDSVHVFGVPLQAPGPAKGQHRRVRLIGVPPQGMHLRFVLPAGVGGQVYAVTSSPGLPDSFAPQRAARDRVAVPIHTGDVTLTWAEASLALPVE